MNPLAAIVAFGVPEQQVDALIEGITGTVAEPVRWVVFGADMDLLGSLDRQWRGAVDLVLAHLPRADATTMDAAMAILSHEQLQPNSVAWLHGAAVPCEPPPGFRTALRVARTEIESTRSVLMERSRRSPSP